MMSNLHVTNVQYHVMLKSRHVLPNLLLCWQVFVHIQWWKFLLSEIQSTRHGEKKIRHGINGTK